jgi:hypothetical protein
MDYDSIRHLSHELLGARYRLEVAAAVASLDGKPVSTRAISDEARIEYNRAQEQVAHFLDARMLVDESDPSMRRKSYRPVASVYWRNCRQLLHELLDREVLE